MSRYLNESQRAALEILCKDELTMSAIAMVLAEEIRRNQQSCVDAMFNAESMDSRLTIDAIRASATAVALEQVIPLLKIAADLAPPAKEKQ